MSRIFTTSLASDYPHHVTKMEKKGRTKEELDAPLMKKFRYLDKLVDELASGKAMDKVLRDVTPRPSA